MRTSTKQEAIQFSITSGKAIDILDANSKFRDYIQYKKAMFSPEEMNLISTDDEIEVHISLEEWMDRLEGRPRQELIMVFPLTTEFIDLIKSVDTFFPESYRGPIGSVSGLKPATHGYIQWCSCPDSVHSFLMKSKIKDVLFYDGDKTNITNALKSYGIKPIIDDII